MYENYEIWINYLTTLIENQDMRDWKEGSYKGIFVMIAESIYGHKKGKLWFQHVCGKLERSFIFFYSSHFLRIKKNRRVFRMFHQVYVMWIFMQPDFHIRRVVKEKFSISELSDIN